MHVEGYQELSKHQEGTKRAEVVGRLRHGRSKLCKTKSKTFNNAQPQYLFNIKTYGFPPGTPAVGPPLTPLGGKTEAGNLGSTPGKGGRGGKAPGRPGGTPFW